MDWGALASAAASIIGTVMSSSSANSEGDRANKYGQVTAANLRNYGQSSAMATLMSAGYNAALLNSQAQVKSAANMAVARQNASLLIQTANYNSLLFDEEIDSVYESAKLDRKLLELATAKTIGTVEAQQSASGVLMGQDSNADVIIDIMVQSALEDLVIKTNADNKARGLLSASAKGEWEANMEARKMLYEAQVSGDVNRVMASQQAMGSLFEAKMNAESIATNAANRAFEAVFGAGQKADSLYDMSTAYAVTGTANTISNYYKTTSKTPDSELY